MQISMISRGEYARRPSWGKNVCVGRKGSGELYYINGANDGCTVKSYSSIHEHRDFVYCERSGKPIEGDYMSKVEYNEVTAVAVDSTGTMYKAQNVDELYKQIGEVLGNYPTREFKVFELSGTVEPTLIDVASMFRPLEGK